ncbi:MAG: hypothetical protein PUB87_04830 [Eubacteriaceae bacterium]|nr:hypothetical protein [Eubacteriaceae bacterium]
MQTRIKSIIVTFIFTFMLVSAINTQDVNAAVSLSYTSHFSISGSGEVYINPGPKMEFYRFNGMSSYYSRCKIENEASYKFSSAVNRGLVVVPSQDSYFYGFFDENGCRITMKIMKIDILRINYKGVYIYDYYPSMDNEDFTHLTKQMYATLVSDYVYGLYGTRTYSVVGSENIYKLPKKNLSICVKFMTKKTPQLECSKTVYKTYGNGKFYVVKNLPDELSMKCSSSNSGIVSVDKTTGLAKITGEGVARITVKTPETERYRSSATYIYVHVKPGLIKLSSARNTSDGEVKVKWLRDEKCSGYQLQAGNRDFSKVYYKKTVTSSGAGSTTLKIPAKYKKSCTYVRIRAYKKSCGKTLYGPFSKMKIN